MDTPAETGLPTYSDAENEDAWIPFKRSAPDFVKEGEGWDRRGFLSPFQGTPVEKIHAIIKAVQLTDKDYVFDLGCGDGRFIIECCRLTSCAGLGVDLDEGLIEKAKANAAAAGSLRAEFHQGDFLDPPVDFLPATASRGAAALGAAPSHPHSQLSLFALHCLVVLAAPLT